MAVRRFGARALSRRRNFALNPDVILAQSTAVVEALKQAARSVPVVFVHVADPVAAEIVSSLAHPGGNVTGITNTEPTIGGKWRQLLKEAAPSVTRAAMLVNPDSWPMRVRFFCARSRMPRRRWGSRRQPATCETSKASKRQCATSRHSRAAA